MKASENSDSLTLWVSACVDIPVVAHNQHRREASHRHQDTGSLSGTKGNRSYPKALG